MPVLSPLSNSWKSPFLSLNPTETAKKTDKDFYLFPQSPLISREPVQLKQQIPSIIQEKSPLFLTDETIEVVKPIVLPVYPSSYTGKTTPENILGCQVIARKLNDLYNSELKQCHRHKTFNHDYFGMVADEQKKGNCLIAIGPNWILSSLIDYFEGGRRDILRSAQLRRKTAEYQEVFGSRREFFSEETSPELPLTQLENLSIYQRTDLEFADSEVWLIFAPVSAEEANRAMAWINLNNQYYLRKSYLAVENMPTFGTYDFEYLFPVTARILGNYTLFESETCSSSELREIFTCFEVSKSYPRLDWKIGTYGAFLLAEACFYRLPIRWENSKIIVGNCGYIQAYDLFGRFERICADIVSSQLQFFEYSSWDEIVAVCSNSEYKAFYGLGKYWLAAPDYINPIPISPVNLSSEDRELIESDFPLRALSKLPESTQLYCESLGYSFDLPEASRYNIPIGTRTVLQGDVTLTEYYYLTSAGKEIRVYAGEGPVSFKLRELLEEYLAQGHPFSTKVQNIMDSYPDFIPSFPLTFFELSPYPEKARYQLEQLLAIN